jgi:hypothetical protein
MYCQSHKNLDCVSGVWADECLDCKEIQAEAKKTESDETKPEELTEADYWDGDASYCE